MGKSGKGKPSKSKDVTSGEVSTTVHSAYTNGQSSISKYDAQRQNSSGCCAKMIFFLVLAVFSVVATVIYVDYKPGQLKTAYENINIPPEVKLSLEKGAYIASDTFYTISSHVKEQYQGGKKVVRSFLKGVDLGGVNLEQLLFKDVDETDDSKKEAEEQERKIEKMRDERILEKRRQEAERLKKEETRIAAEKEKLEKEKLRKENEEKIKKEQKRIEEENARKEQEEKRIAEEKARIEGERLKKEQEKRIAEEKARKEAERLRKEKEEKQIAEEKERKETERLKNLQEKRIAEENARKEDERLKKEQEEKRIAAEKARKEAETLRKEQEKRIAEEKAQVVLKQLKREQEEKRIAEENARKEAERLKREQEKRIAEENARKEAERLKREQEKRIAEENARKEAERLKREQEEKRIAEENARKEAERLKQELEEKRIAEEKAQIEAKRLKKEQEEKLIAEKAQEKAEGLRKEQEKRIAEEKARKEEAARLKAQEEKRIAEEKVQKEKETERLRKEEEQKRIAEAKISIEKEAERVKKEQEEKRIVVEKALKEADRLRKEEEEKRIVEKARKEAERLRKEQEEKRIIEEQNRVKELKRKEAEKIKAESERKLREKTLAEEKEKQIAEQKAKERIEELKQKELAEKKRSEEKKAVNSQKTSKTGGGHAQDQTRDGGSLTSYSKLDITNEEDMQIKDLLDQVESTVNKAAETRNLEEITGALDVYDKLLKDNVRSPRVTFQKAETLDILAQSERSNARLEQAISAFHEVVRLQNVPDKLFAMAGNKCVDLLKFRGWYEKAIDVQREVLARFPNESEQINKLGTLLLYVNKNAEAKIVFEKLLQQHPNDGYALVHLGFILKLEGSANDKSEDGNTKVVLEQTLGKAVDLMRKGIKTRDSGVIEGKFYFHLGDALRRLGKPIEADEVYKEATKRGVLLSFWQRSLYNVEGLKAKPVWTPEETGISQDLAKIKQNWKLIRNEALAILDRNLFVREGENLSDTGKWAQYELYRQGRKVEKNCKNAPITCNLVDSIPQIAKNHRGQAKFSVMEAGTHVYAHSGPTNCRLRAHLGLNIPENSSSSTDALLSPTRLRVADKYLTWSDGEMFVFDDSFDHEVWHDNPGKKPRVILILDLWHPELTEHQKMALPAI